MAAGWCLVTRIWGPANAFFLQRQKLSDRGGGARGGLQLLEPMMADA